MSAETPQANQEYALYREMEHNWLDALVKVGIFNDVHQALLDDVYAEISQSPEKFRESVASFIATTFGVGIGRDKISSNVRVKNVNIYVARILAGSGGLNVVFSPGDPAFRNVQRLYLDSCRKLRVKDYVLPFGIFWTDAYFFKGNEYFRGALNREEDAGWEVFENWGQTWAIIQARYPAFFRLGAPWIPLVKPEKGLQKPLEVKAAKIGTATLVEPEPNPDFGYEAKEAPAWPPKGRLVRGLQFGRRFKLPPSYYDGPTWEDLLDPE